MRILLQTIALTTLPLLPTMLCRAQQSSDKQAQAEAVLGDPLGSTMTLEQITQQTKAKVKPDAGEQNILVVRAASETSPALKHRLWLPDFTLKPGSAQLHFFRAMLLWRELPDDFRSKVENWTSDDQPQPTVAERQAAMNILSQVLSEIHAMAVSEDMTLDHRLRDLQGPAMYAYLLPDVQESRSLARVLDQNIELHISNQDIDAAVKSLRDGFRLAAFVGQGETLIQQLVGIAIEGIMLSKVERILQMPEAPNMYWALATLPRPLIDITESMQFELSAIHRVIPLLDEAEATERGEAYWNAQWASMLTDLQTLDGEGPSSQLAITIIGGLSAGAARQRLIEAGMDKSKIDAMPDLRVVLIDASHTIRKMSDDLGKANFLPSHLGNKIAEKASNEFEQWVQENRLKSGAAVIMGLLFPAVQQAKQAGVRQQYLVNRLMTIEALRMHAANHDGKLPMTLIELDPVPALPNPFDGQPFDYQLRQDDDRQIVTLAAEVPRSAERFKTIEIRFVKP